MREIARRRRCLIGVVAAAAPFRAGRPPITFMSCSISASASARCNLRPRMATVFGFSTYPSFFFERVFRCGKICFAPGMA